MDELLQYIGEQNTLKKLCGDYIFYSTSPEFWKEQGVESVAQFEHWLAKQQYEAEYRKSGHRGFLPVDLDSMTTEDILQEIEKLKQG